MDLLANDFGVLITRPAGKADNLLAGLDELGISYVYQPLITTQMMPLRNRDQQHLQHAELIIFVSVSAVTCLEQQFDLKSLTQPLLLHADKPLRRSTENNRRFMAPAMRVAVLISFVHQQRAGVF